MRFLGLRGKLILSLSILISGYIGFSSYFFLIYQLRTMKDFSMHLYRSLAETISGNSVYSFYSNDQKTLFDTIYNMTSKDPNVQFAMFLDRGGKVIIDNNETREGKVLGTDEIFREAILSQGLYEKQSSLGGVPVVDFIVPLKVTVLEIGGTRNYVFPGQKGIEVQEGKATRKTEKLGYFWMRISFVTLVRKLWETLFITIGLAAGCLAFGALITLYMIKSFVSPIQSLVLATQKVAQGDLDYKVQIVRNDEVGQLSSAFNAMTRRLIDLIEQFREKEKIERELEMARDIQLSLVPHGDLKIQGFDITSLFLTFRQVGGDYFDFFHLEQENRIIMVLGDVSGKGMPAALIMATVRSAVHMLIRESKSPVEIMDAINGLLYEETKDNEFMSFVIISVNTETMEMTYCNAGHLPPIIYRSSKDEIIRLNPQSTLLGVMEELKFKDDTLRLQKGDVMVVFTDGVVELMNDRDEEFGEENLINVLRNNSDLNSSANITALRNAMEGYSATKVFQDDVTVILLKIHADDIHPAPA